MGPDERAVKCLEEGDVEEAIAWALLDIAAELEQIRNKLTFGD